MADPPTESKNKGEGASYAVKRFYFYNPIKKCNEFKTFNVNKMSADEIKKAGAEWIAMKKKEFEAIKNDMNNKSFYDVKPFNYSVDDYSGQSIMMIGSTRSGKSTALNYLMEHFFMPKENKFVNIEF